MSLAPSMVGNLRLKLEQKQQSHVCHAFLQHPVNESGKSTKRADTLCIEVGASIVSQPRGAQPHTRMEKQVKSQRLAWTMAISVEAMMFEPTEPTPCQL